MIKCECACGYVSMYVCCMCVWRSVIKCECACGYVSMYVWYVRVEICD